ncbi:uncharacterized protein LOC108110709 [Drosophila eugracilis]|uniref:uncharacterized protein LOC108110709 n=1 Tax=Drosophila eugracilis TaxID=29029 RepID=UPI001BD961E4|nr:uncharacterized protein LOC108110709 [Drosophila eugracilis]
MEEDLEFLINALSVPHTPLTEPYGEQELLEMRESFKTLQKFLRRSSLPIEASLRSMPRSKAGGDTDRLKERALSSMMALFANDYEQPNDQNNGSQVWNSAESGVRSSPIISECGLRDQGKESLLCESSWSDIGDLAMVPYEKLSNERSSSESTITGESFSSSGISISIPVNLVWNNNEYNSESTDSETTLVADGLRYSIQN